MQSSQDHTYRVVLVIEDEIARSLWKRQHLKNQADGEERSERNGEAPLNRAINITAKWEKVCWSAI